MATGRGRGRRPATASSTTRSPRTSRSPRSTAPAATCADRITRVAAPHKLLDPAAGPLIAVKLHILTRKTLGGLHTDLSGRVLRADGEPLPGLYAAGEAAGFGGGGMHGYRALEGTFLGGCLFSGRAAGRAVRERGPQPRLHASATGTMPPPVNDIVGTNTRETNRLRMLETLLRRPARSRGDLGRSLGVSRATVTALLTEFEHAGIVEQQAEDSDERRPKGRPPLQVSLAPDAAFAVGLEFGHRHLRAAVCDLGGGIVADRWTPIEIEGDPVAMLDAAQRLTAEAVAESGVGGERLIGVGVGFAAPVDARHRPGADRRDHARLGRASTRRRSSRSGSGMPVQVENDANAGAIGEHMFGAGRGVADMIYLQLSAGIGLGLIMAGRPYRGAAGIAGEIGHVRVVDNGLICRCGNRGCLETVASPDVVVELLERSRGERLTMAQVMELVHDGRPRRRAGGRRRGQGHRARRSRPP